MTQQPRSNLAQSVYEALKADLTSLRMRPGERYAESELAARLGVSRTPLRVALYMLVREGYLAKTEGHSQWMVRPLEVRRFEDLYDVRVALELMAIQRICRADPFPDLQPLCAVWLVPEAARLTDGPTVARLDEDFHAAIVAASGNAEAERIHADLTDRIRIIRRLDFLTASRLATTYEEHARLLRALLARKEADATLLLHAHIASSKVEIRHITLHKLALACGDADPDTSSEGRRHAL